MRSFNPLKSCAKITKIAITSKINKARKVLLYRLKALSKWKATIRKEIKIFSENFKNLSKTKILPDFLLLKLK